MSNLRQKTYGIFIRPYFDLDGDRIVHRGKVQASAPCPPCSGSCPKYVDVFGGDPYMLNYISTSFADIRTRIIELMDDIGYSMDDIIVSEIIPTSHIATPYA